MMHTMKALSLLGLALVLAQTTVRADVIADQSSGRTGRPIGSYYIPSDAAYSMSAVDLRTAPMLSASGTRIGSGPQSDLGSAALAAATHWVGRYGARSDMLGYWQWRLPVLISGSQTMWHNPGDGESSGSGPLRLWDALEEVGPALILTSTSTATIAAPTFSPGGGTYGTPQYVTVRCATAGARIRYTTTGRTPTETDPAVPSGGKVAVARSLTLEAKAFKSGVVPSSVTSTVYTMKVATPTFSPDGGTHPTHLTVSIRCATTSATIRYTTDGRTPKDSDPVIPSGGKVSVDHSLTLKAMAFKAGWTPSSVKSAVYTIGAGG